MGNNYSRYVIEETDIEEKERIMRYGLTVHGENPLIEYAMRPCKRLLSSILARALHDLTIEFPKNAVDRRDWAKNARNWMSLEDWNEPGEPGLGSCRWVCENLGISRHMLDLMIKEVTEEAKRFRLRSENAQVLFK